MAGVVPAQYQIKGTPPDNKKAKCKICDLPYNSHSGNFCAICKDAVEHHDAAKFDDCVAGRRRMARARFLAEVPLDEIDKLSLENG